MIAFRHADPRLPFLQEDAPQPAGRWNSAGELTHYFCDTPDGAWAEFLRHEEIDDPRDLLSVRRALWAVDIGPAPSRPAAPAGLAGLTREVLTGGLESWPACQQWARRQRRGKQGGKQGFTAPSAALQPGGAHGFRVRGGLQPGPARDGRVFVLFGPRPDLVGWAAVIAGRPGEELLARVHPL